jgi:hypothetical protein
VTAPTHTPNSERILRAGVDFTSRGELKYARAVHLANELRGRIDEWSAAEPLLARVVQLNPHSVEFRLVVKRVPPVEEWSLILGDAIHNLRSVLDNVTWGLAHLDGHKPKKPTQVAFYVTEDEHDWNDRTKSLESVPEEFLQRMRSLQPWTSGVEKTESLLGLLHYFDNVDKHRDLITGSLHFKELSTHGLALRFEPADTADEAQPMYSMNRVPTRLEADAVLLTLSCESHTVHVDPQYMAKVGVQFVLDKDDVHILLLDQFLGDLIARTREWLDVLYGGDTYAKGLKAARGAIQPAITFGYEDEEGARHITTLPMTEFKPGASEG